MLSGIFAFNHSRAVIKTVWFIFLCSQAIIFLRPAGALSLTTSEGLADDVVRSKWLGDYDDMVTTRMIRALVPYSKTFYLYYIAYKLINEKRELLQKRKAAAGK